MLSVLEYAARMYGVHIQGEQLFWGSVSGSESTYEQQWGENRFRIENSGASAVAYVNGKKIFEAGPDLKVVTDLAGRVLSVLPFAERADCGRIMAFI